MKTLTGLKVVCATLLIVLVSGCGSQAFKDGYNQQASAMRNLQYHMDNPDAIEDRDESRTIRYNVGGESGWATIKRNSVTIH